jgi:phage terminase large subunit
MNLRTMEKKDLEIYNKFRNSPIYFIEKMWKLKPTEGTFVKGEHITWQQVKILEAVENSLKDGKKRISVAAGHGIGKTCLLSWLILWYLFVNKDAQVACTAPTSEQMHDVLWKEIALWLRRMPPEIMNLYDYSAGYLRIKERHETWFARAKTARKDAPEALAGVHGEYVFIVVDEASGVPDEIFRTAEGSLTGENVLVIMISNPTRTSGFFYDSHHNDNAWERLEFSSEDSPVVKKNYVQRIIDKYGIESDEYRIRVLGKFPKEDAIDVGGFVPLLLENDLRFTQTTNLIGLPKMGVDPAGEGSNKTVWAVRDNFKARILAKEAISSPKTIAQKTLTLLDFTGTMPDRVWLDNFGEGANVAVEMAMTRRTVNGEEVPTRINAVNVGDKAADNETYINRRAEAYWRLREWIKKGGELVGTMDDWKQLLQIKYRRELNGKLKIMSKDEMRKQGIESPDVADALMLTFYEGEYSVNRTFKQPDFEPITEYGG